MGGIDVRKLYSNDKAIVDEELQSKLPSLLKKNAYVLHSDHSIPNTVDYETYRYFVNQGMKMGTYL